MINSEHDRQLPFTIDSYAFHSIGDKVLLHLLDATGETGKSYTYSLPRKEMNEFLARNELGTKYSSLNGRTVLANVRGTEGKSQTDRITSLVGLASDVSL